MNCYGWLISPFQLLSCKQKQQAEAEMLALFSTRPLQSVIRRRVITDACWEVDGRVCMHLHMHVLTCLHFKNVKNAEDAISKLECSFVHYEMHKIMQHSIFFFIDNDVYGS